MITAWLLRCVSLGVDLSSMYVMHMYPQAFKSTRVEALELQYVE